MDKTEAVLLRIFVKEEDQHEGEPLYLAIVEAARAAGLAGATVLRGTVGYGSSNEDPSARREPLSPATPLVIEIVDWGDRVQGFLPQLKEMMDRGLVTTQTTNVDWYLSSSTG